MILELSNIGYAVLKNPTFFIVTEDNSRDSGVNIIINNISIQNDDIQNPTLPSLLETYD